MSRFELIHFPDEEALARGVAERWLDTLERAAGTRTSAVALSGGRITRLFFSQIAEQSQTRSVSLSKVEFFWADERCVPPTDPESNFALAQRTLFTPLTIGEARIHRICGEVGGAQAAQQAEEAMRRLVPADEAGQPVLDMVFLGMGEDGHVASLFPEEPEAARLDKAVYRRVIASKPPPERVTLGYGVIAAARETWVVVSGAGKQRALQESLRPEGQTPLAGVIQRRARTLIFTDIKL